VVGSAYGDRGALARGKSHALVAQEGDAGLLPEVTGVADLRPRALSQAVFVIAGDGKAAQLRLEPSEQTKAGLARTGIAEEVTGEEHQIGMQSLSPICRLAEATTVG
jgi:hypothetical protein